MNPRQLNLFICFCGIVLLYPIASSIRTYFDNQQWLYLGITITLLIAMYFIVRNTWTIANKKEMELKNE